MVEGLFFAVFSLNEEAGRTLKRERNSRSYSDFAAPLLASSGDLSMENRHQYYIYTSVNGNCKLDHIHNCNYTWSFRES